MLLLEREDDRAVLEAALEAADARGQIVVIEGEAGIGKSALVAEVAGATARRRVLWGSCNPLLTPRPLGPFRDVARELGGTLPELLDRGGSREELLAALLEELAGTGSPV